MTQTQQTETDVDSATPNDRDFGDISRLVVKIGSSLLTDNGKGLNRDAFAGWAIQLAKLQREGVEVILVSSGAVAEGVARMELDERPKTCLLYTSPSPRD